MADAGVYLEKLSGFSRVLRLEGFAIGPAETADAARILTALGLADREQVKTALRTVYAKSQPEQLRFDRVFDGYFVSEETMRRQAQEQAKQMQTKEAIYLEAKKRSEEMVAQTQERIEQLRKAGNAYMDDALRRTEETIAAALDEVKETRMKFRTVTEAQEQRKMANVDVEV